jgi:hypothetical protein
MIITNVPPISVFLNKVDVFTILLFVQLLVLALLILAILQLDVKSMKLVATIIMHVQMTSVILRLDATMKL